MPNRLCDLLGIKYPIIQGALQWLSLPPLAAAVSEAGGLGIITAASYKTKDELSNAIKEMRSLTSKPFAVNVSLLSHLASKSTLDKLIQVIVEEKPPVVETAGKSPEEYMPVFKEAGIMVIHKVPSVRFAKKAESLGVSAVTLIGYEAGGHPGSGNATSMVQIAQAARSISVPLIAGGGIADGSGIAAALALGADGVVMGTRFIASEECAVQDNFKKAIIESDINDTMLIQKSINRPMRVLVNDTAKRAAKIEEDDPDIDELMSIIGGGVTKRCYENGQVNDCAFPLGQSAGLIKEVLPVKTIIEECIKEAQLKLSESLSKL